MSGDAVLIELIFTASILQPYSPIEQIKDIVSQMPMDSTLRKKCKMAIAFREGRLADIIMVGNSMMGLDVANGGQILPVQQNIVSPVLSNVSQRDSLQEKEKRICLSQKERNFISEKMAAKGGNLSKEEKKEIATALGLDYRRVSNHIGNVIAVRKQEQKENLDSVSTTIAFREEIPTDNMAIGKSTVGLEASNGNPNLPVRQNVDSPILTLGDLLRGRKEPNRLSFSQRSYILEKMDQKDGNLSKEEKVNIGIALGLTDRRVSKYINDVKNNRKRKIQRQEQKENLESVSEDSVDYDATYKPLVWTNHSERS
ncbi:unnamed protein product [Caenorhabditis nigoni]